MAKTRRPLKTKKRLKFILAAAVCLTVVSIMFMLASSWDFDVTTQREQLVADVDGRQKSSHDPLLASTVASGVEQPNLLHVHASGSFVERVRAFNEFLQQLREDRLVRDGSSGGEWQLDNNTQTVIRGSDDDYLEQLTANHSRVITVTLPWLSTTSQTAWSSFGDTSNLLIQTYHEWTADDTLCSCIEKRYYKLGNNYDAVYNRTCNRRIGDTRFSMSLRPVILNGKPIITNHYWPNNGTAYPARFYTDAPRYAFLVHIHRDAVVTRIGDVVSSNVKLVLYTCLEDMRPVAAVNKSSVIYDELFVIAQYWGQKVFHRMVEVVPRLALCLDFLRNNPQIRLFASETGKRLKELLLILGLDPARLVSGDRVRARTLYQPRSTGCGYANVQESQMLSQLYRDYIRRTFGAQPRNRLVLIRRSGSRRFTDERRIEAALKRAARDFNLTYTLFADNPTPSLNQTMIIFHSAVIVVAPHGAGLSNLLFSQPGTYVVEGVCEVRHVNLCFQRLAHILGHHWHGVTSRGGCHEVIHIPPADMERPLRTYLKLWVDSLPRRSRTK